MTEKEIIKGCKSGNQKAQRALFERYSPKAMGICRRYAKSREEAEDIFQEAFVRVFNYIDKVEKAASLEAWVKRIVVNTAINFYQKHKKHYGHADVEERHCESSGEHEKILARLSAEELMALVNRLPDGYRVVFNLYAIEGYSHKEIGEQLGITESTSKSQLSRAKKTLKGMVEKLYAASEPGF